MKVRLEHGVVDLHPEFIRLIGFSCCCGHVTVIPIRCITRATIERDFSVWWLDLRYRENDVTLIRAPAKKIEAILRFYPRLAWREVLSDY